jgi:hypothetical protein
VTTLATTPRSREKPWLYIDADGKYRVFVPALRTEASGASWSADAPTPGASIPLRKFFVAKPGDSAAAINAALACGLNVLFTPGVYPLEQTLHVTRADSVVLGIGFPTLQPLEGIRPMAVDDVDGVRLAGLLFDAGVVPSRELLTIGTRASTRRHVADPVTVQDVFFRIGGAVAGKAGVSLVVHSNDAIIDHVWAWRADHGDVAPGWNVNPAETGVLVDGSDVLATGLFVEHYRHYQVVWNGENGRTIFFQNEMPYDVPRQRRWMTGASLGVAAYKVGAGVKRHEAWGLGSYCFFSRHEPGEHIHAARAFEVPDTPGVRMHGLVTVSLGGQGTIDHVVNDRGARTKDAGAIAINLVSLP